jgi:hypothetical protein
MQEEIAEGSMRYKGDMVGTGQSAQEEKLHTQETKLGDPQSTFRR